MRKDVKLVLICVSLILILSISFVSAGFFSDLWSKLFGGEAEITGAPIGQGICTCYPSGGGVFEDNCGEGYVAFGCDEEDCGECECIVPFECVEGACCNLEEPCGGSPYGTLYNAGYLCNGTEVEALDTEYKCTNKNPGVTGECGSDIEKRDGTRSKRCTGNSEFCPDWVNDWGDGWVLSEACSAVQKCQYFEVGTPYRCVDHTVCLICGNGYLDDDEECDDAHPGQPSFPVPNDGCSVDCLIEDGWDCVGTGPDSCFETITCGDGYLDDDEECDDGNEVDEDGCTACDVDEGWTCTGAGPGSCTEICGNGTIETYNGETCDDNNKLSDDGCSDICLIETHYVCPLTGGACTNCDVDGDEHDSTSTACDSLSGDDCDDDISDDPVDVTCPTDTGDCSEATGACAICIYDGAFDFCEDGIDQSCNEEDATCTGICIDEDSDDYGVCPNCGIANGCTKDGDDCDDSNEDINPGVDENCTSDVDYDCDGEPYNGCVFEYYSIDELIISTNKAAKDAEISIACVFEIKDSATGGSRILETVDVEDFCIKASMGANFSKCKFIADNKKSNGLYSRTFKCNVGAVAAAKTVRCAVNENVCEGGEHPSSNPAVISVTAVDFDFIGQKINRVRSSSGEIKKFALEGSTHTLEVLSVLANSIKLTISSNPVNVTLGVGNREEVDINGDGVEDIEIMLVEIISGEAVLDIEVLEQTSDECEEGAILACGTNFEGTKFCANNRWSTCSYISVDPSDEEVDTDSDGGSSVWIYVLIIIIFLLLIIIAIFFMKKKLSKMSRPGSGPRPLPGGPPPRRPLLRRPPPRGLPRSPPRSSPPRR